MTAELHRLSNGLRVAVEPMPGFLSASVGVYVTAGGRHERPEQNGVAHFLEHMAFKGTPSRTARAIAEEIEDVGGYINAYTGKEMTAYYARVMGADVERGLTLLADILLNPLFDAPDIEVERNVILQEIGQSLDTPDDVIFDWLQEVAYPGQAFGRTILGAPERVQGFGRDDLAGFVTERYGPEQLIIAAAGAVDPEAVLRAAERLFGGLPRRASIPVDRAAFAPGERREARRLEQAHVAMAFQAAGHHDADFYPAHVYGIALGGGMSSRLFQELREKRGLCYSIYAHTASYLDTGMLTLYAGTSGDRIRELEEVAIDELRRAAEGFAPAEVARAQAQMTAGLVMGLESPSGRAERMARSIAVWDKVTPVEDSLARIAAVTPEEVRAFGETLLRRAAPALALLGPVRKAPGQGKLAERMAA